MRVPVGNYSGCNTSRLFCFPFFPLKHKKFAFKRRENMTINLGPNSSSKKRLS